MGFIGVYKALYDYTPQSEGELQVTEGDIVYVLEKSTEDAWWKAKKKASGDDEDEPEGLIPNNYIEEVSQQPCTLPFPTLVLLSFLASFPSLPAAGLLGKKKPN